MPERNPRDLAIYPAGDGRWRVVVSTGRRNADGGYKRRVRYVRGTKTDARKLRDEMRADVSRDTSVEPVKQKLGDYLQTWHERSAPPRGRTKRSTWLSYGKHVRVHVQPDPIASRRLCDLTTDDVGDFYWRLAGEGTVAG